MNCACGDTARFFVGRDGKPGYCCPHHRCKFYAVTPIQCDGYHRVMPNAQTPLETVIVRFEALAHPESTVDSPVMAMLATVQGNLYGRPEVCDVLHDEKLEGMWYPARDGYLFTEWAYPRLVTALRRLPNVLVEEVPPFFFRCVTRLHQALAQHAEAVEAGKAITVDPDDSVYTQLKPFQKRGVEFVVAHGGRGMIADDMGLGKTVQAIAVAHLYRHEWPVLVMCPMSLMENWMKEFNKFAGVPYSRMVVLQGNKARVTDLHDVVIVSYSSLKCLDSANFNVVIADESHYIKTGEAKRAQQALRLCRGARRVVLLSGTPAMARPLELYTQLQALQPSLVPSKTQYGARYCNAYVSRFGVDMTGHSHTDELKLLLRHFMIRRTKKELGDELPSKTRQLLYVFITEKEKKALEKQVMALRRSFATHPDGMGQNAGGDYTSRAPNAFELKIATAQAKMPAVRDYVMSTVEQHLDSGEKIIFFAHHQCMMEALRSAVEAVRPKRPIDYIFIAGDTPGAQREQLANHFRNEPSCGVAVLSMQSSGTGHNFTCASTVVFAELDWNPSTHLQCEDRVHRIGQSNPCSIKYLLAEGTSDSVIWPMLQDKLSVTSAMLVAQDTNGETAGPQQLSTNANQQKVARRDLSEAAEATQGTLDGFLKPSQRSSASSTAAPRASANGTDAAHGIGQDNHNHNDDSDGDDGEDVVCVTPAETARQSLRLSGMPMLTPPQPPPPARASTRGSALVSSSPSPRAVLTPEKPPVLISIAEHEKQRLAKAPTAATALAASAAATRTSAAALASGAAGVGRTAEPKTSVLDLMRTSPATCVGGSPPPAPPGLVDRVTATTSNTSSSRRTVPAPSHVAPAPVPVAVAAAPVAAAAVAGRVVVTSDEITAPAAPRARTTFSFSKGPASIPPPQQQPQQQPQQPSSAAETAVAAAPARPSSVIAPTSATPAAVARVSISIGFKRRTHDVAEPPEPPVRAPRWEPSAPAVASLAPPPPSPPPPQMAPVEMATANTGPAIVFDPANLSVSAPTKPRTTFVFHTQKPRTP